MKVGQLIAKLKADGEWENTIVFFFGDPRPGNARVQNACFIAGA
jgi:phosphoglycerol transferase MdoB-like AlkP superfamily enzyme